MPYTPESSHVRPAPKHVVVLVRAEQHPEVVNFLTTSKKHFLNNQDFYSKGAHETLAAFQAATLKIYNDALESKNQYVEYTHEGVACFVFERYHARHIAEALYDAGVRRWTKTFYPKHAVHGEAMATIYYGNKANRFVWEALPSTEPEEAGAAADISMPPPGTSVKKGVKLTALPGVETPAPAQPQPVSED